MPLQVADSTSARRFDEGQRFVIQAAACVGLVIAIAAIGLFVFMGSNDRLMLYHHLLADFVLLVLTTMVAVQDCPGSSLFYPTAATDAWHLATNAICRGHESRVA